MATAGPASRKAISIAGSRRPASSASKSAWSPAKTSPPTSKPSWPVPRSNWPWMSDVGCWMFPSASLPATSPLHAPRTTPHHPLLALDVGCRMLVVGCSLSPPLPAASPLYALRITHYACLCLGFPPHSAFRTPHSALALRGLLGGLGVSASTV